MKSVKVLVVAAVLACFAFNAFAQTEEPKKHFIFIGINPITAFLNYYEGEVSIALTGLLEVGAQVSYLDITGFLNMAGGGAITATGNNYMLHAGGVIRIFPSQAAEGFFLSGRVMMLNFTIEGLPSNYTDFAVGMDLGWRFRWMFEGWGLIFQIFGGIERAVVHQTELGIPILPIGGLHFGVCF